MKISNGNKIIKLIKIKITGLLKNMFSINENINLKASSFNIYNLYNVYTKDLHGPRQAGLIYFKYITGRVGPGF